VKNHDFTPKKITFLPILGGGGAAPGSCCEIDQEMDAILLIIGIVFGVCRIFIKSVQQCTYFLFSVNLLFQAY
jgi:hypothetical protein